MGKLGACVIKKVVSVTFIFTNPVKCYNCLFPCVCVFYSFTPMLFLFLVFPSKDFVLSDHVENKGITDLFQFLI